MLNTFIYSVSATLALSLSFLYYKNTKLNQELEKERNRNISLEAKLNQSNRALEKIALDTKAYKEIQERQAMEIKNKYDNILNAYNKAKKQLQTNMYHTTPPAKENKDKSYDLQTCRAKLKEYETDITTAHNLIKSFYTK